MRVVTRVCLYDYCVRDGEKVLELKRGQVYTTTSTKDDVVTVFSTYWASGIPAGIFGGALPLP